jgi:hypothetical protein
MDRSTCYRYLILFFFIFQSDAFAHVNRLFNGKWEYVEYIPGSMKPYSVFDISLNEGENGKIYGAYCFVTQYGNRDDCSPDGELNVNGHAVDLTKKASVAFYSFFGVKNGIAELSINDDNSLTWTIIRQPQEGEYYGPNRIVLKKITSETDAHVGDRLVVAKKAYLYDAPSKLRQGETYVIEGDYVKLVRISTDLRFWEVKFSTKSGRTIEKWIDCQDIDFCAK